MRSVLVVVALLFAREAPAQEWDLRREVDSLNRAIELAFNAGDLRGVAAFYADDGKLMGPGNDDVVGRDAIDRYWLGIRGAKSWKLQVLDIGGDRQSAYQVGRSILVTSGQTGDRTSVSRFIVIWKRQSDGQFKILIDFYHF